MKNTPDTIRTCVASGSARTRTLLAASLVLGAAAAFLLTDAIPLLDHGLGQAAAAGERCLDRVHGFCTEIWNFMSDPDLVAEAISGVRVPKLR